MKKGAAQTELKTSLNLFDATAISVGAIVGAGIFVVTGIAAGQAGSALVVSMLIAAFIALFSALSIAELSARYPTEGSVYEFGRELISPFAGFLSGWMWMLSNTFAGAAVSLGFAYYFTYLLPGIPTQLVAAIVCIAFTALNYYGIRQSALLNNFLDCEADYFGVFLYFRRFLRKLFESCALCTFPAWRASRRVLHFLCVRRLCTCCSGS